MGASSEKLLLGIDIGTTGSKCTFYDVNGNSVATGYSEYRMYYPNPGWVEENPEEWWESVVKNVKYAVSKYGIDSSRVAGIGVSCTNSIIPVDRSGKALYNAILQLDQRAMDEVEWIKNNIGDEKVLNTTGNRIAPGTFSLPTIRWFMKHRPDIMDATYKFLVPSGFIVQKLTGEFTINSSRMATTLLADIRTGEWAFDIAEKSGVPVEKLPKPLNACDIAGYVTEEAADATGLIKGTTVVAGAMDTVAAAVGAGAVNSNDAFLTVGTTARLCLTLGKDDFDSRFMNCRNIKNNQWLSIAPVNGSGVSLRWFRDNLGSYEADEGEKRGVSSYEIMDEEVEACSPGSGGLIYLPYITGERSPIWDPDARGVFFGLQLKTTREEMIRAIMEGVAYALRHNLEVWEKSGSHISHLTFSGGGAKSPVWGQILADVLNRPLLLLDVNETETLGGAILAGVGVGIFDNAGVIAREIINNSKKIEPNPENGEKYSSYFELFKKLYIDVKDDFKVLSRINRD